MAKSEKENEVGKKKMGTEAPVKAKESKSEGRSYSRKENKGVSTKGVLAGAGEDAKDEPIEHVSAYRRRPVGLVESGLPRQEASYQNRDRSGAGLEHEPAYQKRVPSFPKKGPKLKKDQNMED